MVSSDCSGTEIDLDFPAMDVLLWLFLGITDFFTIKLLLWNITKVSCTLNYDASMLASMYVSMLVWFLIDSTQKTISLRLTLMADSGKKMFLLFGGPWMTWD